MELETEVSEVARDYFQPWNAGTVEAPQVEVIAEDGRNQEALRREA